MKNIRKGCFSDKRNKSDIKSDQSDDKISEIRRHGASKIVKQIWIVRNMKNHFLEKKITFQVKEK